MPKSIEMEEVVALLRPGMRVLLHAGPVESVAFREALRAAPEHAAGVTFTGLFIPNVNRFDYGSLTPSTRVETLFVSTAARPAFEAGRLDLLPFHYSAYLDHLRRFPADLAILHLPPARDGRFSCGLGADVAEGVRRFARRVVVLVDPNLPFTHGGTALAVDEVEAVVEIDEQDLPLRAETPDPALDRLAETVAGLVGDGDTLQIGIGRLQSNVLRRLTDRRNLRVHSGMITDEIASLFEAGAIASAEEGRPPIVTGIALGGAAVRRLAARPEVVFHGIDVTHDVRRIAAVPNFVAINSALEIDLFGQVDCETVAGRQVSGIGGSVDFTRGARLSPGGRAIVALTARSAGVARIVPRLRGGLASLGRADVDTLVTEHGSVRLRDLGLDARAHAIVSLADPDDRPALTEAWERLRARI